MGTNSNNINWEKIQQGVNEVERLIGQKEYNAAMITARQTLELMVRLQMERAGIVNGSSDLMSMIDCLYKNRWISKATCERYHKIRIIGNKAVHDGDNNPYSANQAYHELSQEVYTFANDYQNAQKGIRPAPENQPPARQNRQPSRSPRTESSGNKSRKQKGITFTAADLLKLLIPIVCIALLFVVIKIVRPNSDTGKKKTTAAVTTEAVTDADSSNDNTAAETETEIIYRTTSNLNVRSRPSTDGDKLGQLPAGSVIEYVGDSDDGAWAKINYNGQEGYVSKEFLSAE